MKNAIWICTFNTIWASYCFKKNCVTSRQRIYCMWYFHTVEKYDLWDRCSVISKHGASVNVCAQEKGINSAWMHACLCVCVCGPPGLPELQCECCITGSHWELKDPGGRQRHFLLDLPAYWLPRQHCLTSPWATLATWGQSKSDQHPRVKRHINGDKTPQGMVWKVQINNRLPLFLLKSTHNTRRQFK